MMEMLITEAPEGQRGGNPHGQGGEDLGEEGRVVIGHMSKARGDMKGSDSAEEAVLSKLEDWDHLCVCGGGGKQTEI